MAAAIEFIRTQRVDAAVLDINLHGVVDFAIVKELDQRKIPFVFATGYEPTTVPKTYEHILLWRKPFVIDALIEYLGPSNFGRETQSAG